MAAEAAFAALGEGRSRDVLDAYEGAVKESSMTAELKRVERRLRARSKEMGRDAPEVGTAGLIARSEAMSFSTYAPTLTLNARKPASTNARAWRAAPSGVSQ